MSDMSEMNVIEFMLSEVRRGSDAPTGLLSRQPEAGSLCTYRVMAAHRPSKPGVRVRIPLGAPDAPEA